MGTGPHKLPCLHLFSYVQIHVNKHSHRSIWWFPWLCNRNRGVVSTREESTFVQRHCRRVCSQAYEVYHFDFFVILHPMCGEAKPNCISEVVLSRPGDCDTTCTSWRILPHCRRSRSSSPASSARLPLGLRDIGRFWAWYRRKFPHHQSLSLPQLSGFLHPSLSSSPSRRLRMAGFAKR